jgi:serine/threonine protein kinase
MSLSPGARLDRYEIVELLGRGGMGEVYRARDPKLAREVALKILRVDNSLGTDGAPRLLREARAAAGLSHANVLAVYDVGEVHEPESLRGVAYIAMELVVGRTLTSYVGDDTIPLSRRIGWLRDVAFALGAAHKAGIVHRDVKTDNVMIRVDGVVKVLDFGIARRASATFEAWSSTEGHGIPTANTGPAQTSLPSLTGQGTILGTPFYMAPEQLRGEEIDARADQFGWGVVAYWLLTGKPPWPGGSEPLALLSQILTLTPRAPADANGGIPACVSSAILRALEKQREARFPSMAELVGAMDGAAGEPPAPKPAVPSSASRASVTSSTATSSRRGIPALPALIAAALVLVCGAGTMAWRRRATRVDAAGQPAAPTTIAAVEKCRTNADCVHAHRGEAWHCHTRRHACVELASADCKVYSEPNDAEAEDIVWFGGIYPVHTDPGLVSEMRALELAREDFAHALGPSAGRNGELHAHPIGLVICDEGTDAVRAAHHLADEVEVPAVIGFRSTTSAFTTIPTVFMPDHVLSFVTISQAPEITRIPEPAGEPRLVWRSTLNVADFAAPLAHLVSDVLEPAARAPRGGIGDRPYRVAVALTKATHHPFVESLFGALRFNDRSALENGPDFRQFMYGQADAEDGDVADAIALFAPQVIVFADQSFFSRILTPVETRWGKRPRPVYLTASGLGPEVAPFAGRDPARRHRFYSVTNLATTMTNAQLVLRYNSAFPAEPIERSTAPQPSYDAFYVLAYASYALGERAVSGPALSSAIERLLPPGRPVNVGPTQIFSAFQTLRTEGHIDLNGAIGSLDFDPATGEAPIDYAIVCPGVDDHGVAAPGIDSGLVYDARAKKLVGSLRCP